MHWASILKFPISILNCITHGSKRNASKLNSIIACRNPFTIAADGFWILYELVFLSTIWFMDPWKNINMIPSWHKYRIIGSYNLEHLDHKQWTIALIIYSTCIWYHFWSRMIQLIGQNINCWTDASYRTKKSVLLVYHTFGLTIQTVTNDWGRGRDGSQRSRRQQMASAAAGGGGGSKCYRSLIVIEMF